MGESWWRPWGRGGSLYPSFIADFFVFVYLDKETDTDGLMDSLTKIEYHFHLFDVYAQSSPTAEEELLGSM